VPRTFLASDSPPVGGWLARIARTFGGLVGAVWLGMALASLDVVGPLASGGGPGGSASFAAALGLVIATPLAFGIVLILGWNEGRPTWPLAGFVLGSEVASGLLIVAIRVDDAGAPSQAGLVWWAACVSALVLGAFGAFAVIQRRGRTPSRLPDARPKE